MPTDPFVACVCLVKGRVCTCCKIEKPTEAFGIQRSRGRNPILRAICKACGSLKAVEWAKRNPEKRKANWRRHAEGNRESYREANRKYYAANRESRIEAQRKRRAADKRVKSNARALLAYYVKKGKIQRKPCKKCGADYRVHAHHHDYSKPLEVTWLCSECHGKEHRREQSA